MRRMARFEQFEKRSEHSSKRSFAECAELKEAFSDKSAWTLVLKVSEEG